MRRRTLYFSLGGGLLLLFLFNSNISSMGGMGGMHGMSGGGSLETLPPGLPVELLPAPESDGAQLLQQYCSQCHPLPGPGRHTAEEWPAVMTRMTDRMEHMSSGMMGIFSRINAPTSAEKQTLRRYLQEHAQRAIRPEQYPELDSTVAGRAFTATCARCHTLPDPRQHTAIDWIGVEGRMQRNMTIMGRSIPDDATMQQILEFLQDRAQAEK